VVLACTESMILPARTESILLSATLLHPVASCLPAGCHVASCCTAFTSHLLLSCRRLTCRSSIPRLHLHRLVVALHLVTPPPPPVLSSTPPPLDAPPPHVALATPPPVCLLFTLTGCCIASCGISASHLPTCPPLCLHLLAHLVLVSPRSLSCCLLSTCDSVTATLHCLFCQWLVIASFGPSVIRHLLLSSPPPLCIVQSLTLQMQRLG
jgi:hypothetical protein